MPQAFINASAVGQIHGDREVLNEVDLTVHDGQRIALVGPNGSGKSTLLRVLAGLETPATGTVTHTKGVRVTYLPQVTGAGPGRGSRSIRTELESRTGVTKARLKMEEETRLLSEGRLDRVDAQVEAVEAWTRLGGADLDARISRALELVGINPGWADRTLDSLSGGQLARVNLATLHLSRVDVALLDEPGNHLDAEGIGMFEELATDAAPAVLLASHDRTLLEKFANEVVELKRGRARKFRSGWASYTREQQALREQELTVWDKVASERRRLVELERRISQQAAAGERRARRTGETDRFIRHMAIESAQKNTAASGISKRIEQLEVPEKPWQENLSTLLLDAGQKIHSPRVAVARDLVSARGDWRSKPVDLSIGPGERLLLTGPNGSGKSSLIQILAGRLQPDSGSIDIPASVRLVELAQEGSAFAAGEGSLADRFRKLSKLDETATRTSLAALKLGAEQADRDPASLSPGELTRAELALVARTGAACLLLDEPSNHLDIEALEVLEEALAGWPGALVVASHDQAFRKSIRFDRTVAMGRAEPD